MKGQHLPTDKTKDMKSEMGKVKAIAGGPLHDAKTKIPGVKPYTK